MFWIVIAIFLSLQCVFVCEAHEELVLSERVLGFLTTDTSGNKWTQEQVLAKFNITDVSAIFEKNQVIQGWNAFLNLPSVNKQREINPKRHETLVLGATGLDFLFQGRIDALCSNSVDFLDMQAVSPLQMNLLEEFTASHVFEAKMTEDSFSEFASVHHGQYSCVMFDWCVFNGVLEYQEGSFRPSMNRDVLEQIKVMLSDGGDLYFSDVYQDDKVWFLNQLNEAGFDAKIMDPKDLEPKLKNMRFEELEQRGSMCILAKKK